MRVLKRSALLAGTIVLAVACSSGEEYPDPVVQDFAEQCMAQGGATVDRCTCVLEGLQKEYALKDYLALIDRVGQGTPPPDKVVNIFRECARVGATEPADENTPPGPAS